MEDEIEEALQKIYKFKVKVSWRDFRIYDIIAEIEVGKIEIGKIEIAILYDTTLTLEANIEGIKYKIDKEIARLYRKEN